MKRLTNNEFLAMTIIYFIVMPIISCFVYYYTGRWIGVTVIAIILYVIRLAEFISNRRV